MFEKIEDVSFVFYFVRHAPNMKPLFIKKAIMTQKVIQGYL